MEDLMEGMGWIKYLMKCFCGWYPWIGCGEMKREERKMGQGGGRGGSLYPG
jgi:hypothetical protein